MRIILFGVALMALAACQPRVPDSGADVVEIGRGVGFGDNDVYQTQRDQALRGDAPLSSVPESEVISVTTLPPAGATDGPSVDQVAANSGVPPVQASPSNPPPQVVSNAAGISGENDFEAVSAQRDIASDAQLIARNRQQYQVIAPTDLPTRPGTDTPNIVAFALQTTNPVGASLYARGRVSQTRHVRACAAYASSDLAQEAFLAAGGPQRDRADLDPDGDGFACGWDPAPFRAARRG